MQKFYFTKTLLPALMLALFSPLAAVSALADDGDIELPPTVIVNVPETLLRTSGNLFGTTRGTAPEGWTLSFPDAEEGQHDELAAGVQTKVSPNSMPQMKDGTFSSSPKALTRLEYTLPLTAFGITEDMLKAYHEKGQDLTLYFSCDAEAFYTTIGQYANPSVKLRAVLLNADQATVGMGEVNAYFSVNSTSAHLFGSANIPTNDDIIPSQVKFTVDMKPCDGMEDIADEGVTVGNVRTYVCTDNITTRDITVMHDYPGSLIGEGRYVAMGYDPNVNPDDFTANIVFDAKEKFTRAVLKDMSGNIVATSDCLPGNRAVLPVKVSLDLKTDEELTGEPSATSYAPATSYDPDGDGDDDDDDDDDDPDNDDTTTLTLELEGLTPTAISSVKADDNDDSAAPKRIFNIAGQKVTTPQPGQIYVVDGKKGVVK